MEESPEGSGEARREAIAEFGSPDLPRPKSPIHTLSIIGQVEGHILLPPQNKTTKYEHILPMLVGIEESDEVEGVLLILNTVGGDVEAGLALAEMVASMRTPSVSLVLGGGHSIGVPIACAADRSFIVPSATMTVHPIRLNGFLIGVPQTYDYLDKMQDRVIQFIVRHSRVAEPRLRELMFRTGELARDVGTVLVGEEAVREGLVYRVGGLAEARAELMRGIEAQRKSLGRSEPSSGERGEKSRSGRSSRQKSFGKKQETPGHLDG